MPNFSVPAEPEVWRAIPSAPGYEASNLGRVRSLRLKEPRIRNGTVGPCGFRTINVYPGTAGDFDCRRIGDLVAEAWLGPRPEGSEVRRLDGDTTNDHPANLAHGSMADVLADHAARARREEAAGAATHCPNGHRYADLYLGNWGRRRCRAGSLEDLSNPGSPHPECCPLKPAETPCVDCGNVVAQRIAPGWTGRPLKRCPDCRRRAEQETYRRYSSSAKGRERTRRADARYRQSEHGAAMRAAYEASEARRRSRAAYRHSEQGRAAARKASARYLARKKAEREAAACGAGISSVA